MGIAWGVSIVVLTPPLWWGVMEMSLVGDAYERSRLIYGQTGEWPAIAAYDRKAGAHRGLDLWSKGASGKFEKSNPKHHDRDIARALADQARVDAVKPDARRVREWLEYFARRLQAEADFDMKKGAVLWR